MGAHSTRSNTWHRLTAAICVALVVAANVSCAEAGGSINFTIGASSFANTGSIADTASSLNILSGSTGGPVSSIGVPAGPSPVPSTVPSTVPAFGASGLPVAQPNSTASPNESRGPDLKWGDALNADLLDSDTVHAKLNYFMDAGRNGSQQGVGISFTIAN